MSNDVSKAAYRGVLLQDPRITRWTLDEALSSYTEAELQAGVPINLDDSALVLTAYGGLDDNAGDLTVSMTTSGLPADSIVAPRFTFAAAGVEYGQNHTQVLQRFDIIEYNGIDEYSTPAMITLTNGTVVAAYQKYIDSLGRTILEVALLDHETSQWDTVEVLSSVGTHTSGHIAPCLLQIDDDTLMLYAWEKVLIGGSYFWQLVSHVSKDSGASWSATYGKANVVSHVFGGKYPKKTVAVMLGSVVSIMYEVYTAGSYTYQIVSTDYGITFSGVGTYTTGDSLALAVYRGKIFSWYVDAGAVYYRTIPTPFDAFSDVAGDATSIADLSGSIDVWVGDGILNMAYHGDSGDAYSPYCVYSLDGVNWDTQGYSVAPFILQTSTAAGSIGVVAGTSSRGSILLMATTEAGSLLDDFGLLLLQLGGHSNVTIPTDNGVDYNGQLNPVASYVPMDYPDYYGWVVSSNTPIFGIDRRGLRTGSNSGLDRITYTTLPGSLAMPDDLDGEMVVSFISDLGQGGKWSSDKAFFRLTHTGAAATGYSMSIRLSDSANGYNNLEGISIYDNGGAAYLLHLAVDVVNTRSHFIVAIGDGGKVRVWMRELGPYTATTAEYDLSEFTLVLSSTLGSATYVQTESEVQFGVNSGLDYITDLYTSMINIYGSDDGQGAMLVDGELVSAARALTVTPVDLPHGVYLKATSGPAQASEEFTIPTYSDYSTDHLDPNDYPSPLQGWRSQSVAAHSFYYDLSSGGENTRTLGTLGLALLNMNLRGFVVKGRTAAGAETTIATVSTAVATGVQYVREGNVFYPAGTTANADRWFDENELVGYMLRTTTNDFAKVTSNTAGYWSDDSAGQRPHIMVENTDVDTGWNASGSLDLYAPDVVVLVPSVFESYQYIKIELSADILYDQYQTIGQLVVGSVVYFPKQYSRGRALSNRTNTESATLDDGTRISRILGPARGGVSVSWVDGTDTSQIHQSVLSPDYIQIGSSAKTIVGTPAAIGGVVEGILTQTEGDHRTMVYLPSITGDSDSVEVLTARNSFMYGRVVSGYQEDVVLGSELDSEVVRIGNMDIEEEV
jgi:hypothetical protein